MKVTTHTIVGQLAAEAPATIPVLQRFGIRYCCDGRRSLGEVCEERHQQLERVTAALEATVSGPQPHAEWAGRSLSDLTVHIVEAFHEPLRQELPRLLGLAERAQAHADLSRHLVTGALHELSRLQAGLEPHMAAEELDLFPLIRRVESGAADEAERARVRRLCVALQLDHAHTADSLLILAAVRRRYDPASHPCSTLRLLMEGVAELDQFIQLHVHIENNVLFPRAAALATEAGTEESS
jgi:regulator of cell morphogenesis and NO signaling